MARGCGGRSRKMNLEDIVVMNSMCFQESTASDLSRDEVRKRIVLFYECVMGVLLGVNEWNAINLDKEVDFCFEKWKFVQGKTQPPEKLNRPTAATFRKNGLKKNIHKFTLMLALIKETLSNMNKGQTMLKRELFYRYVDLADSQTDFDTVLQEITYRLQLPRHLLCFVDFSH